MLNKRYIKSINELFFVLISFPVFLFQFFFCYILERKDKKSFKRNIIVLISFLILFVSISFLVNIGEEMSLPGFLRFKRDIIVLISVLILFISISFLVNIGKKCPFRGSVHT